MAEKEIESKRRTRILELCGMLDMVRDQGPHSEAFVLRKRIESGMRMPSGIDEKQLRQIEDEIAWQRECS